MANFDDASFEHVLPQAAPAVVDMALNASTFTPLVLPAGMNNAQRFRCLIEPCAVAMQLRFGSETTGFTIPANTAFDCGWLVLSALPQLRAASTTPTVRCLVSWPSRA